MLTLLLYLNFACSILISRSFSNTTVASEKCVNYSRKEYSRVFRYFKLILASIPHFHIQPCLCTTFEAIFTSWRSMGTK